MNKILKNYLLFIILLSITLGVISILFFRDIEVTNEWRMILQNLELNKILSVHSVNGVPVPSIYMPPLYPFFLYAIKNFFQNLDHFLWAVQLTQLLLNTISVYLTYKILCNIFSKNLSLSGTLIFSVFPLNVYAVSQISSITLQVFLINLFIYSYIKLFFSINYKHILIFSLVSGLLMLLRGEYFVFVILSLVYLYFNQRKIFEILIIVLISVLVISPYLYRNYNTFGVITITKSSGINLLKGNNPRAKVEGAGGISLDIERNIKVIPEVKSKLNELNSRGPIKKYDLIQDQIFMDQAIKFIKDEPVKYLSLYIKKFLSFMFIDLNSSYPNYYSPIHIIPKLVISILSFLGVIFTFSMRVNISNFFNLFYLANIGLFSVFFILPRYSLSLLTIQIILSLFALRKIKSIFKL